MLEGEGFGVAYMPAITNNMLGSVDAQISSASFFMNMTGLIVVAIMIAALFIGNKNLKDKLR